MSLCTLKTKLLSLVTNTTPTTKSRCLSLKMKTQRSKYVFAEYKSKIDLDFLFCNKFYCNYINYNYYFYHLNLIAHRYPVAARLTCQVQVQCNLNINSDANYKYAQLLLVRVGKIYAKIVIFFFFFTRLEF